MYDPVYIFDPSAFSRARDESVFLAETFDGSPATPKAPILELCDAGSGCYSTGAKWAGRTRGEILFLDLAFAQGGISAGAADAGVHSKFYSAKCYANQSMAIFAQL